MKRLIALIVLVTTLMFQESFLNSNNCVVLLLAPEGGVMRSMCDGAWLAFFALFIAITIILVSFVVGFIKKRVSKK